MVSQQRKIKINDLHGIIWGVYQHNGGGMFLLTNNHAYINHIIQNAMYIKIDDKLNAMIHNTNDHKHDSVCQHIQKRIYRVILFYRY